MPQPISAISSPVQEPYSYQPIGTPPSHGLNLAAASDAAQQGVAPYMAEKQRVEEIDNQATKAAKFQQLINTGAQGMQAYIADIGQTHPDLAQKFTQELNTVAPHLKTLSGKELTDFSLNTYDGWHNQVSAKKLGDQLQQNPNSTMRELLPASGLGSKDQLTILSQSDAREATAKASAARSAYLGQLPALKQKIADSQAAAKIRAAEISASRPRGGVKDTTGYQYTYGSAKKSLKDVQDEIDSLMQSDPGAQVDPDTQKPPDAVQANLIREASLYNKQMGALIKERDGWQSKVDYAIQHGAKPADMISDSSGGNGGASAPTRPTLTSTPQEVAAYLSFHNKADDSTSVSKYMQLLKGAPQAPQ